MQKEGLKYYSLFATMLFVLPVLLRLLAIRLKFDVVFAIITYLFIGVSFIYNFVDTRRRKKFAPAFNFDNSYRLDIFSYLAALGFFVEFISNVALLIKSFLAEQSLGLSYELVLAFCTLFSLLTGFYFLAIGVSYGTGDYDFRQFKLFHIVIMLWSIFKLLSMFIDLVKAFYDVNSVLMHLSIMTTALFFYYFVKEIESDDKSSVYTVFYARMCAYMTGFYSADSLIIFIANRGFADVYDLIFAFTSLTICLFSLFFEKSIIHNTNIEE